jgi:hypothetical protein
MTDQPLVLNHKQLQTIAGLDAGRGVRLELSESDEGAEIYVHVLYRYGYSVEFVRLDGSLVCDTSRTRRARLVI